MAKHNGLLSFLGRLVATLLKPSPQESPRAKFRDEAPAERVPSPAAQGQPREVQTGANEPNSEIASLSDDRKERLLIIGLDIGTSCTKVCVRYTEDNYHRFVDFGEHAQDGHRNLIDTAFTRQFEHDHLSLSAEDGVRYEDLKLNLMTTCEQGETDLITEADVHLTAFAALVLRYVIRHIVEHDGGDSTAYRNKYILHVGIPSDAWTGIDSLSDDHEHKTQTVGLYRRMRWCLMAGWALATTDDKAITELETRSVLRAFRERSAQGMRELTALAQRLDLVEMAIIPEVLAELVPLRRSETLLNDGLHLMIDIGRGTLDLMVFRVGKDLLEQGYDARYTLLWCDVSMLGTAFTIEAGRDLQEMKREVTKRIRTACHMAKEKDSLANEWHQGADGQIRSVLQVFIMGGGSSEKLYSDAVTEASTLLSQDFFGRSNISSGYVKAVIPDADEIDLDRFFGYEEQDIHRLLVAYGLSFEREDAGGITDVRGEEPRDITGPDFELNWDLY